MAPEELKRTQEEDEDIISSGLYLVKANVLHL